MRSIKSLFCGQIVGLPISTMFRPMKRILKTNRSVYIPQSVIHPYYDQSLFINPQYDMEDTSIMCKKIAEKEKAIDKKMGRYSLELRSKRHQQAKKKRARRKEGKKIQLK